MELHLKISGSLLVVLSILHVFFPAYFKWKEELKNLSLINRQMMYVHTFFIAFVVFSMGVFCLTSYKEMIETSVGKKVALGFGIFWVLRLLIQFFGYSSQLWKGKTFETIVHIIFSLLWIYLSTIFILIFLK
jgi:hypothetical protein